MRVDVLRGRYVTIAAQCLLNADSLAFAETDINKRSILIANLLRQTDSASARFDRPEAFAEFETYLISTWVALGARPELFEDIPGKEDVPVSPLQVSLNREEASSLLCQSIIFAVQ